MTQTSSTVRNTRITYLANIRLPTERAYGLQIMKTCEALSDAGAQVELVVPTRHNRITHDAFSFYTIPEQFNLVQVPVPDLIQRGTLGFVFSTLWFSEKARWLKSFWTADVVYSRDALVLFQYLLLGRPFVFEAHAKPTFLSRVVARRARGLVVISQGLKNAYTVAGVAPEKIRVAPDAVDERLFDGVPDRGTARVALGLPLDKKIVLYAGHLYPRKGADTLAGAASQLPDVLFVFAGGTEGDVAGFTKRWEKQHNVLVVGHVPHAQVPWYLRAADVLVLPNSAKDEDSAQFTSPMKLFEYMASGTPVLASDVPAIREILDENCAYLVEADSPKALAQGITTTFSNPDEARAKARQAKEKVTHFTWGARAQTILRILEG